MLPQKIDDNRTMICDKCRKIVPINEVKYVLKENDLSKEESLRWALCAACRETKSSNQVIIKTKLVKPSEIKEQTTQEKKAFVQLEEPAKKVFLCARCNYKFKFNPIGISSLRCPFCGKNDRVTEYKSLSTEELIRTSDNDF